MPGYEIDFLPVGTDKSGDAIALRFGNLNGPNVQQVVVAIDAGFQDSGKALVDHIRTYYNTNRIDLVISTHPDQDHIGGLEYVVSNCDVRELWMHQPWNHTDDIAKMFVDGRVTDASVTEALRKSLEEARSLERLAVSRGISIREPFAGVLHSSGQILVLGPTIPYYESLLPDFRCTPVAKPQPGILQKGFVELKEVVKKVAETLDFETLDDSGETTAENNSSAIVLVIVGDDCLLFTADAGIPALTYAINALVNARFDFTRIKFIQVPHHGSARNVGPTLLDRLIGPKLIQDTKARSGFVSVAKLDDHKHPAKKVLNAFRRRGVHVTATAGQTKNHFKDAPGWPARTNWVAVDPLPFFEEVEE